eukprot:GHVH01002329.1.p1 GENE.GHVH01002329.1~~GHVH01002329.1.p1  ORF type:complete len:192 (-),score=32.50 GHVH01002329.1:27-536(-)
MKVFELRWENQLVWRERESLIDMGKSDERQKKKKKTKQSERDHDARPSQLEMDKQMEKLSRSNLDRKRKKIGLGVGMVVDPYHGIDMTLARNTDSSLPDTPLYRSFVRGNVMTGDNSARITITYADGTVEFGDEREETKSIREMRKVNKHREKKSKKERKEKKVKKSKK